MKFKVKNRSGEVMFIANIEACKDTPLSTKLGLAVKWAHARNISLNKASLRGVDLSNMCLPNIDLFGADLRDAKSTGVDLAGASLTCSDLRGADLAYACLNNSDLNSSDLRDADLTDTFMRGASLRNADLRGATILDSNMRNVDLGHADLTGADFRGVDLSGTNFYCTKLDGACYGEGVPLTHAPVFVKGLDWPVIIMDKHMKIGCSLYSLTEWAAFDDRRIISMGGHVAPKLWRMWKAPLLAMAKAKREQENE